MNTLSVNASLHNILFKKIFPLTLLVLAGTWQVSALAATGSCSGTCVYSNSDDALSKEEARERKEQWDDTRSLRHKVNGRNEKEFDKYDLAIDDADSCSKSLNMNAYWEPNTRRCLDRKTGRPVRP